MTGRVVQTTGTKLILSTEVGIISLAPLCWVKFAKEVIYYYIIIIIVYNNYFRNVLSTMKNTVGNGFIFCNTLLSSKQKWKSGGKQK